MHFHQVREARIHFFWPKSILQDTWMHFHRVRGARTHFLALTYGSESKKLVRASRTLWKCILWPIVWVWGKKSGSKFLGPPYQWLFQNPSGDVIKLPTRINSRVVFNIQCETLMYPLLMKLQLRISELKTYHIEIETWTRYATWNK